MGEALARKNEAIEVLNFLNKSCNRHFRVNEINLKFITARLKSGITSAELKKIVLICKKKWIGTEYEIYLRPSTLFNATKCEQYLEEIKNIEAKSEQQRKAIFLSK